MNRHRIGKALLVLGALIGIGLASLALWAEIEASQYGFVRYTRDRLSSLRCPVFIGPTETLPVRVTVVNRKADYRAQFTVRITKSSPVLFETQTTSLRLDPGERQTLEWTIGPANVDLGHFIFVDVYQFGGYPNLPRQSQCGVYVLPVPLPGNLFLWGSLVLTLALLWGGWALWRRGAPDGGTDTRSLTALAVLVPLSMGVAYWGHWLLAAPLVLLDVLALLGALLYGLLRLD